MKSPRIILGLETSCDDTGVALYDREAGLLAHRRYSQIQLHADYGGVVPELASRDHIRQLLPLIAAVQQAAGTTQFDAVAYTAGPGLAGALLVGAAVGRSLAFARQVPAIAIHHMEGHLLSPMLSEAPPEFPFLALLVSGGHTLLADIQGIGRYRILGESLDDAAGEAFDKTAQLLDLGYPGGPAISQAGRQGDDRAFDFPRPMTDRPGLDFSFSGLKTAVATAIARTDRSETTVANVAASFEAAIIDTLVIKCRRALEQTGHTRLVVAGGVSANQRLRHQLEGLSRDRGCRVYFPPMEFSTDNGAMIALAGSLRLAAGQQERSGFTVHPRWSLTDLLPV